MNEMFGWIQYYYGDGYFLIYAIIAYVYLFFKCKDLRGKFLVPIIVILLVVTNPLAYEYVYSKIAYWRLLWMFPNAIIVALAIMVFVKSRKKKWIKIIILVVVGVILLFSGTNTFVERYFILIQNAQKISQEAIDVSEAIMKIEESPKVVVPWQLYSEMRQYAPEISLLYGRNVDGYITSWSEDSMNIAFHMEQENPDYDYILSMVVRNECEFIVTYKDKPIQEEYLSKYGYVKKCEASGYYIYYNEEIVSLKVVEDI